MIDSNICKINIGSLSTKTKASAFASFGGLVWKLAQYCWPHKLASIPSSESPVTWIEPNKGRIKHLALIDQGIYKLEEFIGNIIDYKEIMFLLNVIFLHLVKPHSIQAAGGRSCTKEKEGLQFLVAHLGDMIPFVALPGGIRERGDSGKSGTFFSCLDSLEITGFDDKLDCSHRSHSSTVPRKF